MRQETLQPDNGTDSDDHDDGDDEPPCACETDPGDLGCFEHFEVSIDG